MALMPIDEALKRLLGVRVMPKPERLTMDAAAGRTLANDLYAEQAYPFEDNSAMDGYALQAGRGPWEVVGESAAGSPFRGTLNSGQAVRIFTGGVVPAGADTILIQENAELDERVIRTNQPLKKGQHIRRQGSDIKSGTQVMSKGDQLKTSDIAALAGLGFNEITCFRRPKVAIFSTGDELIALGSKRSLGEVYDSNALFLRQAAQESGADVVHCGHLPDDRQQVDQALKEVVGAVDLVLLSGGVSVGDHDHVGHALKALCDGLTFYNVRMKPGKPVAAGQIDGCTLLGLPGNPASTMVSFELFARPVIRQRSGASSVHRTLYLAPCLKPLKAGGARGEFLRAQRTASGLIPKSRQGSGDLSSLLNVDALIFRPAHAAQSPAGAMQAYLALEGPDCNAAPEAQWDRLS